ncbi:hypothetical protein [Streptomyces aquilus]|uniref:hypothetical protein n=1 Tax=Streptomyces aquilus TaxID=2548456 RepID=UPI0036CF7D50
MAAHWQSRFEQYAHERVGRHVGLTDEEMTAIRDGLEPTIAASRSTSTRGPQRPSAP